jgi:Sulfate permease family
MCCASLGNRDAPFTDRRRQRKPSAAKTSLPPCSSRRWLSPQPSPAPRTRCPRGTTARPSSRNSPRLSRRCKRRNSIMYTLTPSSMQKPALVVRWVPALSWLGSYQREWLRFDLVAGLTTAAVVIPKAMAYAAIAGLPLEVGLYTSLIPLVVYAVLGTSRPLSVTTSGGGPAALLSASATLSLLVGAFLLLAGLFRLGVVANLISDPVLTGFRAGFGLVIILDQLPQAPRDTHHQGWIPPGYLVHRYAPIADINPNSDSRRRDAGPHAGPGAFRAQGTGGTGHRGSRYCRLGILNLCVLAVLVLCLNLGRKYSFHCRRRSKRRSQMVALSCQNLVLVRADFDS